jgi:hypothetical protein
VTDPNIRIRKNNFGTHSLGIKLKILNFA